MHRLSGSAHLGPLDGPPSSRHKRARLWNYRAMTIASVYAEFAVREARGISPTYERLSLSVAGDEEILALLETVPAAKRQPNLLLGVVRFLGGPVDEPAAFHDFTVANWPAVEAGLRTRATQTNEAGRVRAGLLPVLASLRQPAGIAGGRHRLRTGALSRPGTPTTLRRPSARFERTDPRLRAHRSGAANAATRGGMAVKPGSESARHHQSGRPRLAGGPHLARAQPPPRPAACRGRDRRSASAAADPRRPHRGAPAWPPRPR